MSKLDRLFLYTLKYERPGTYCTAATSASFEPVAINWGNLSILPPPPLPAPMLAYPVNFVGVIREGFMSENSDTHAPDT